MLVSVFFVGWGYTFGQFLVNKNTYELVVHLLNMINEI
jgi:hypothetical protein